MVLIDSQHQVIVCRLWSVACGPTQVIDRLSTVLCCLLTCLMVLTGRFMPTQVRSRLIVCQVWERPPGVLACLLAPRLYPRLAVKSWPHPSPSPYHGLVSVSTRASGCEHASHPSTQQGVHSPHQECQFHSEASICRLRVVLVSCLLLVSRLICIWLLHRVTSALIRVSRPNLGLATHLPNIMVSYLPLLLVSYLRLLLVSVPFSQLPLLSQVPLFLSRSCISLSSRLCPYLFAATPRLACSFSQVSQLSLLLS